MPKYAWFNKIATRTCTDGFMTISTIEKYLSLTSRQQLPALNVSILPAVNNKSISILYLEQSNSLKTVKKKTNIRT